MDTTGIKWHGKTERHPYTGSKRFDYSCRNHGGCKYCEMQRRRRDYRARREAELREREWTREGE